MVKPPSMDTCTLKIIYTDLIFFLRLLYSVDHRKWQVLAHLFMFYQAVHKMEVLQSSFSFKGLNLKGGHLWLCSLKQTLPVVLSGKPSRKSRCMTVEGEVTRSRTQYVRAAWLATRQCPQIRLFASIYGFALEKGRMKPALFEPAVDGMSSSLFCKHTYSNGQHNLFAD